MSACVQFAFDYVLAMSVITANKEISFQSNATAFVTLESCHPLTIDLFAPRALKSLVPF